jgi:hypothetical protein
MTPYFSTVAKGALIFAILAIVALIKLIGAPSP